MAKMKHGEQKVLWRRITEAANSMNRVGPEEQPRLRGTSDGTGSRVTNRGHEGRPRIGPRKKWLRPR